jgi:hypothetical protein
MARSRKFRKGRRVRSAAAVARLIVRGEWLYLHDRPTHPGWIGGMHLWTIQFLARSGHLRRALPNERTP